MTSNRTSNEEFLSYSYDGDSRTPWRIMDGGTLHVEAMALILQDKCYGYNTEEGCAEWAQPKCRRNGTTFELLSGGFVSPSGSSSDNYFHNKSIGADDCRVRCWNDCDCQAYVDSEVKGCIMYSKEFEFRPDPSGLSWRLYVIRRPRNGRKNIRRFIAISVSITLLLVSSIIIIFCLRWKGKGREGGLLQLMTPADTLHNANELDYDNNFSQNLKVFSFASIVEATNNFSTKNKLGEGGFGPVYKGKLPEGLEIAVKRLSRSSGQGLV